MTNPLKAQRDRFLAFAFAAADLLLELNESGVVTYAAGAAKRFFGHTEGEIIGKRASELFGDAGGPVLAFVLRSLKSGNRLEPILVPLARADESQLALLGACRLPEMPSHTYLTLSTAGASAAGADARDKLSGLLAKEDFATAATQAVEAARSAGLSPELTFFELDGFKDLCERLGVEKAQGFLRGVGGYLRARSIGDVAARLGDEQYGVVHRAGVDMGEIGSEIASIARSLDPEQRGISVERASMTVGDELSEQELARAVAFTVNRLAEGKVSDMNITSMTDAFSEMLEQTLGRITEFRRTISDGKARHVFQPIVALEDRRLHHCELLVRFEEGKSPYEMISFAEDMRIIQELDMEICRSAIRLLEENPKASPLAVNVSAHSIGNEQFVTTLANYLRRTVVGSRLLFEITESAQLENLSATNQAIQTLRKLGHEVSLDDFGAGAAGFSYLQALDVDFVKFDGSYIRSILDDSRSRLMLKAMASLCLDLDIETVGEMVETEEQAITIREIGVQYGQGWLFGKPSADLPTIVQPEPKPSPQTTVSVAARRRGSREVWG